MIRYRDRSKWETMHAHQRVGVVSERLYLRQSEVCVEFDGI